MSPSPITSVTNAPNTGRDDVRVVVPEVLGMVRTMGRYLESLSDMCEERLVDEETEAVAMDLQQEEEQLSSRAYLERLPWAREKAREEIKRRRRREEQSDGEEEEEESGSKMPASEGAEGGPVR